MAFQSGSVRASSVNFWGSHWSLLCGALVLGLGLSACNPRDPEVLSTAERACAKDRSKCPKFSTSGNNDRQTTNARPAFPDNLDGIATNYILEREEQALTYLRFADEILAGTLQTGECFVVTELEPTQNQRNFVLDSRYPYCISKFSGGEVRQSGRVKMSLGLNADGKLQALSVRSEIAANGGSSLQYFVSRLGARRSFEVDDIFSLELFRVEAGPSEHALAAFKISDFRSTAVIAVIEFNETKEKHEMKFQTWGQFSVEDIKDKALLHPQLSTTLNYRAKVVNGGSSWFDVVLTPSRAQGPAIQKPLQEWAECGSVAGSRELRFDYLKDKSRERNLVTYSTNEIRIEDPKSVSPELKWKRASCLKTNGPITWHGIQGISWAPLFK